MQATQSQPSTTVRRSRNPARSPAVAASAPQAVPPATERRQMFNRRASDSKTPVVDIDALAASTEQVVKNLLASAMDKAVHKGVQLALQQTVAQAAQGPATATNEPAATTAPTEPAEPPVVRNGVRCPDYGTVTGRLWMLYGKAGAAVTLTQAKALAEANGMNPASAAIALYNWRKFHGVPNPQ